MNGFVNEWWNGFFGAALGTGFTFLMTVIGSAVVFFTRKEMKESSQKLFLGFAAGVMIAASIWSLLLPAAEMAEEQNLSPWIPLGGGFILGGGFLRWIDFLMMKLKPEKMSRGSFLLFSAVTMHNIPEGMAVGLAFAAISSPFLTSYAPAIGLALGIGIQNFPEGAAIALPLRKEGLSRTQAFLYGSLTGVVEPVFGILVTLAAGVMRPMMPWLLSFAAGAMIYVTADELIPRAKGEEGKIDGTAGVMLGFFLMMILDVALG